MNRGDVVFVAVLEDRHVDDEIILFGNLEDAHAQIAEWKESYGDDYGEWEEEDVEAWENSASTEVEDGPHVRIEKKVLQ